MRSIIRAALYLACCCPLLGGCLHPQATRVPEPTSDEMLRGSMRRDRAGWKFAHLEGSPERIGYQHGYLFAKEIGELIAVLKEAMPRDTGHPWTFFRQTAQRLFWPRVPESLRAELHGIVRGANVHGEDLDLLDLVAANAFAEIAWYYIPAHAPAPKAGEPLRRAPPGSCSAFIATGSYTADGKIVIGHNTWMSYPIGRLFTVLLDVAPERGHRFVMDTLPGFVHSLSDFYVNDAGLMVTETTITQFKGYDPLGIPEFVRARRAIQEAETIDQWVEILTREPNGGYANSWLIGDRKTGEIARLENGIRNQPLERTRDGYFVGANFPSNPRLIAEETRYRPRDDSSMEVRRKRWEQLMKKNRGRIDIAAAQRFLADHVDATDGKERRGIRSLCGHGELDAEARPEWEEPPFWPSGAVGSKVTDSDLAAQLSL